MQPEEGSPATSKATARFKVGVNRITKLNLLGPKRAKVTEEVIPEVRRRFLFDDCALKEGCSVKDLFYNDGPPPEDMAAIVDKDDEYVETFVSQQLVGDMIDGVVFRCIIIGLIVVNSILIGLQTDEQLSVDYAYMFSIFDQTVLAIFVCEIILKWYYGFWIFWKVGWNILDFVIIVALLLGPTLTFLGSSRILRILRVLRAFRSLKSVSALAGLTMVVQTILQSVPDMANIVLLLCIILLVFAVSGVTLFGRYIPSRFENLPKAMFSLFICVTQDGWVGIFQEFKKQGGLIHIGGAIYFFFSIMVGAFVFANLVVAVVVTNLELAMKELKAEKLAMEDTLATTVSGMGLDNPNDSETVPIVKVPDVMKNFDPTTQNPLQYADLKNLNLERLQNYGLILSALEDNLAEYTAIREDLLQLYDVVRSVNVVADTGEDPDSSAQFSQNTSGEKMDISRFRRGDIMSNLMRMEQDNLLSSRQANTLGDVLRIAASNVNISRG